MEQCIDRYVVLETLGERRLGVVYGAYDPKIDRRVAIQVFRTASDTDEDGARLLREVQSLARVSHPNVLAVYDAGDHEGHIFVAMEYVPGGVTMFEWLHRENPAWRAILARYLDAARGLAALHAAGLVHGDFTSNNVLLGDDGRVRVTDVGLPGMAGDADAHRDQYGFCSALHEALCGGIAHAAPSRVPARIRSALARGLSTNPQDRFPSMDALVAELSHDRRARWLRMGGALVAAASMAFGAIAIARSGTPGALPAPCAGAERKLTGVWDEARKQAVRAAFMATASSYAKDAWEDAERALDAYTARWVARHTQTCEATRVHHDQSEELMDVRIACLEGKARELQALTALFASGHATSLERSAQAMAALPSVDGCTAMAARRTRVYQVASTEVMASVDHAMALSRAGDYTASEKTARDLLPAVKASRDRALESNVHFILARALAQRSEWRLGEAEHFDGLTAAEEAGDEVAKARALVGLVSALSQQENRVADALRARQLAEAVLDRLPEEKETRAILENNLSVTELRAGRYADSLAHGERALALREAVAPDSYLVASTLTNLGNVFTEMGETERALEQRKRAVAIHERRLGPHHPLLAFALSGLGYSQFVLRRWDEALQSERRSRVIFTEAFGHEHPHVARAGGIIADILRDMGRLPEALAEGENTLAMAERIFPKDRDMLSALATVAMIYLDQGRTREALALQLRALALCEQLGNPAQQVPEVLRVLGEAYLAERQPQKALAHLERSLTYQDPNKKVPDTAKTHMLLARALWETGRDRARARTLAERARDAYAELPGYEPERAATATWLSQRR
ncbi:serine/threonine-protein kinase [Pendulispora rubella]|uniref:Serine/threonine-protein kinase n=1 Tax=Pendulispora rubella TaxID=2741070 RepID=A0ABZ2L2G2_9BACT